MLASNQTVTKHSVWISMNVLRKMEAAENTDASIRMEATPVNVTLVTSLIPSKHTAVSRKVVLQGRVVRKPINANPGLKVNRSNKFFV